MSNEGKSSNFWSRLLAVVVLTLVGTVILILRDADPLLNLVVYTEDGQWIGFALTRGWVDTFLHAKPSYFVWGNLLLLWAAAGASSLSCGTPLSCLPFWIAISSYLFFAACAVFVWTATREILPRFGRLALFAFLLLVPLGDSSNEIIGRLSNVGFVLVPVCVSGLFVLESFELSRLQRWSVELMLVLCAATNPVCIFLIGVHATWRAIAMRGTPGLFFRIHGRSLSGLAGLLVLALIRRQGAPIVTGRLIPAHLVEVAVARSLLYPFVFPFYVRLSDGWTVGLLVIALASGVILYRGLDCSRARRWVLYCCFGFVVYLLATLGMRPSLTEQLGAYRTTFPDRYFMGLNALVGMVVIPLAFQRLIDKSRLVVAVGWAVRGGLVLLAITQVPFLFELDRPRFVVRAGPSYAEQLCRTADLQDHFLLGTSPDVIDVPIYSAGWSMRVPRPLLQATASRSNCTQYRRFLSVTDENWDHGIARRWSGFCVPNEHPYVTRFVAGRSVRLTDGDYRRITAVESNGEYLNVYLDGPPIDARRVGEPTTFDVEPQR